MIFWKFCSEGRFDLKAVLVRQFDLKELSFFNIEIIPSQLCL